MIEFDPPRSIRVEINDRREYVEYVPRDQLDELRECIADLWERAAFTMSPANRESWMERLRDAGIEVEP